MISMVVAYITILIIIAALVGLTGGCGQTDYSTSQSSCRCHPPAVQNQTSDVSSASEMFCSQGRTLIEHNDVVHLSFIGNAKTEKVQQQTIYNG